MADERREILESERKRKKVRKMEIRSAIDVNWKLDDEMEGGNGNIKQEKLGEWSFNLFSFN